MRPVGTTSTRLVAINLVAIALAAAFAIAAHAVLPAPVDELTFDGALVQAIGFPAVAVSYFVLLFAHCALVVQSFGRRSNRTRLDIGLRFGLAFAMLYLVGMQEVVVEASPFSTWGLDFVAYQFFMGVGDAVPVLALCTVVALVALPPRRGPDHGTGVRARERFGIVLAIALAVFAHRTIGHTTGIVESDIATYPLQTHLWTALFGVALGGAYVVLYPVFAMVRNPVLLSVQLALATIGANWVLFNSFIGLLFSDVMPQMLLRSGLDATVLFVASIAVVRYVHRRRTNG